MHWLKCSIWASAIVFMSSSSTPPLMGGGGGEQRGSSESIREWIILSIHLREGGAERESDAKQHIEESSAKSLIPGNVQPGSFSHAACWRMQECDRMWQKAFWQAPIENRPRFWTPDSQRKQTSCHPPNGCLFGEVWCQLVNDCFVCLASVASVFLSILWS